MAKFKVNIPELSNSHRKYSVNEFLVEFAEAPEGEDRKRLFRFIEPVAIVVADENDKLRGHSYEYSTELFRALDEVARSGQVLVEIGARSWNLSYASVYQLNHALRTPARRKGGLNIVRHFLENQKGSYVPIRGDFTALLAYLEIRPLFKSPVVVEKSPQKTTSI